MKMTNRKTMLQANKQFNIVYRRQQVLLKFCKETECAETLLSLVCCRKKDFIIS